MHKLQIFIVSVCDAHCLLYLKTNDTVTLSKKGITALKVIGSFIQLLSHQQYQLLETGEKTAYLILFA